MSNFKDERLFTINDVSILGGYASTILLQEMQKKYPDIKVKDLDPTSDFDGTVWQFMNKEANDKVSITNIPLKPSEEDSPGFGVNRVVLMVDFVDDDDDAYYVVHREASDFYEEYSQLSQVEDLFTQNIDFVGEWVGDGSAPASDVIRWIENFDDIEQE